MSSYLPSFGVFRVNCDYVYSNSPEPEVDPEVKESNNETFRFFTGPNTKVWNEQIDMVCMSNA